MSYLLGHSKKPLCSGFVARLWTDTCLFIGAVALSLAAHAEPYEQEPSSFASGEPIMIKVGATPMSHAEILEYIKPALLQEGIDLQVVEFNDYLTPNIALEEGYLDANFFQNQPYLDVFNSDYHLNLVSLGAVHVEPMGIYSARFGDLRSLNEGATVAIPNDPSNHCRALRLLEQAGLIKLEDSTSLTLQLRSITSNPKNLRFEQIEASQLPLYLAKCDAVAINANFAQAAGLNPLKDALITDSKSTVYANIVVTTLEKQNMPQLKTMMRYLHSTDTSNFILRRFQGIVLPIQSLQNMPATPSTPATRPQRYSGEPRVFQKSVGFIAR